MWRGLIFTAALIAALATHVAHERLRERWPPSLHGSERVVAGRVASLPERDPQSLRFLFEPFDPSLPSKIRAGWYEPQASARAGECWALTLRLRTPHGSMNPGGFDYEGWLFASGVGAVATVKAGQRIECPSRAPVLEARQALSDAIHRALADRPAAPLFAALTIGDESQIAAADWDAFRATGTSHLIAISGFNIALVAGVAWFLGRWLWSSIPALCLRLPAQRAALVVSALAAGAYALLAGFDAPVQRAVIMLWIVIAAAWLHRLSSGMRVLGLALAVVLLLDPFTVLSPGLWLSFGAVAAIFYTSLGRLHAPGFWHGAVHLQWLIAVALLPLSLLFFHGASLIAPLVNLLAVPFFTLLTPWALAALLIYAAWPEAGDPLMQLSAIALEAFRDALLALEPVAGTWQPPNPSAIAVACAAVGVALLLAPRGLPLRALGIACLTPLFAAPAPRDGLSIAALDVGQGLAVVIRTANHVLLYDAGPAFDDGFDAGASIVVPYLAHEGIRQIDALVQSHGDRDHSGGVAAVRRQAAIAREIGTASACVEGERWEWDGVRFEILNGPAPGRSSNNGGCVLQVRSPQLTVLLPADIERDAEHALVLRYGERLRSDLLIAPHHGSKTSSTPGFVEAVRPEWVIHSAGWRHHFRHPRPEVVARYDAIGAWQFVTGVIGAIEIGSEGVHAYRVEQAHFWNAEAEP